MRRPHTVVIGGGIVGLSVAWALARTGRRRVTLLEAERSLATHSSARNAQIWLPVDDDLTTGPLAQRSAEALTGLLGEESHWLRRGEAVALDDGDGAWILRGAKASGLEAHPTTLAPWGTSLRSPAQAFRVVGAGVMDTDRMIEALRRACKDAGVVVQTGRRATAIETRNRRVCAVHVAQTRVACDEAVNAAGAWASKLGRTAGVHVPLVPLRRHLMLLEAPPDAVRTTAWRFGPEGVYVRPESGGVLACPCDEVAVEPCLPAAAPEALEWLAERLGGLAPALIEAPVRTHWACLRTYAHDRELVLGPDPRVEGLIWQAGFGGRGMTVAVGAALLCAEALVGSPSASAERLLAATRADREQPSSMIV